MTTKTTDSEYRWERYKEFYGDGVAKVMAKELPGGITALITVIQEHFDYIREEQDREHVGSDSLFDYESQLVMAVAELGEGFNYLLLRNILENLFDKALSADRIVAVSAGNPILNRQHKNQFKDTLKQISAL
ncbi:MAG: hypothetical protein OEX81_01425 [Candidatus Pacebacteria bacterium]|nr:hypothetical protein [Candidatus Paceibacterota bacterium]